MSSTFFHGWSSALRVALSAAAIYVAVVAALRIVGERALAKMSGYDLIVTVTLGSLVATIPITSGLSFVDGLAALVTFLALQELTRFLQSRSRVVHHAVRERPYLVLWDGELLEDRIREIAVTADEVRAAVRRAGMYSLADAQAVVLENDGEWSVLQRGERTDLTAMEGLEIPDRLPSGASGERWRDDAAAHTSRAKTASSGSPPPSASSAPV